MGCACSKGRSSNPTPSSPSGRYVFTNPTTGQQTTYNSIYQAEFAKLQAGGGSITPADS